MLWMPPSQLPTCRKCLQIHLILSSQYICMWRKLSNHIHSIYLYLCINVCGKYFHVITFIPHQKYFATTNKEVWKMPVIVFGKLNPFLVNLPQNACWGNYRNQTLMLGRFDWAHTHTHFDTFTDTHISIYIFIHTIWWYLVMVCGINCSRQNVTNNQ